MKRYLLVGPSTSSGPAREGWTAIEPLVAAASPFAGNPTRPDDEAYIVYTSGTTKDPKGVVHRVAYTFAKRMQAATWFDCTPDDLVWCTAGTGWAKSLWNVLLGPWSYGSCLVLHEGGFVPEERMNLIRDLGVTVLCQAPTEYRLEAKLPDLGTRWKLPKLRHCVSAGEPLNPEVLIRWREAFGITILDGYGQTENSLLVANVRGMDVRPGSMGKPTPGHDVAVIDAEGSVCEPGVVGDIALRGAPPTLFTGYYKNEGETNASRRGEWYLTGDRAQLDDDGYFWFVGRSDDVISSGAYRIGPFEVESALLEHPAVQESAVVGSPDADRGNIVKAFVVLRARHRPEPGARARTAGPLQTRNRTVQVSARDRVHRRTSEDALGKDPARRIAASRIVQKGRDGRQRVRLESHRCKRSFYVRSADRRTCTARNSKRRSPDRARCSSR